MNIAIIGMGVVGQAVAYGARKTCEISTYDIIESKISNMGRFDQTALCFVCVPTPSNPEQNLAPLIDTMEFLQARNYKGVVAVKSTVLPGTMASMASLYPKLRLVHNPEFLTERNANEDFLRQDCVLLSGRIVDVAVVDAFYGLLPRVTKTSMSPDYETTEYAKYLHNCILPVVLSFLNEVHALIGDQKKYDLAIDMAKNFGNVGRHSKVPGPDGKPGWGGMCFAKDMLAFQAFAKRKGPTPTLDGAIASNAQHRPAEMGVKPAPEQQ